MDNSLAGSFRPRLVSFPFRSPSSSIGCRCSGFSRTVVSYFRLLCPITRFEPILTRRRVPSQALATIKLISPPAPQPASASPMYLRPSTLPRLTRPYFFSWVPFEPSVAPSSLSVKASGVVIRRHRWAMIPRGNCWGSWVWGELGGTSKRRPRL